MKPEPGQDVLSAVAGDQTAYGRLVRAYAPSLASTLSAYGVAPGDVEDVVQDAFIAAWRALADYDKSRPFKAWLFQIALNKARDWRRKRFVRRLFYGAVSLDTPEAQSVQDTADGPEAVIQQSESLRRIEKAVSRLPEHLRQAFLLTTVAEMTYAEAGAALGISLKALDGRLLRARRILQAAVRDTRET